MPHCFAMLQEGVLVKEQVRGLECICKYQKIKCRIISGQPVAISSSGSQAFGSSEVGSSEED